MSVLAEVMCMFEHEKSPCLNFLLGQGLNQNMSKVNR